MELVVPPRISAEAAAACRSWRSRRSSRPTARGWPASTSSSATGRRGGRERAEHDPRLHGDERLRQALRGLRDPVPGAPRPPGRARARARPPGAAWAPATGSCSDSCQPARTSLTWCAGAVEVGDPDEVVAVVLAARVEVEGRPLADLCSRRRPRSGRSGGRPPDLAVYPGVSVTTSSCRARRGSPRRARSGRRPPCRTLRRSRSSRRWRVAVGRVGDASGCSVSSPSGSKSRSPAVSSTLPTAAAQPSSPEATPDEESARRAAPAPATTAARPEAGGLPSALDQPRSGRRDRGPVSPSSASSARRAPLSARGTPRSRPPSPSMDGKRSSGPLRHRPRTTIASTSGGTSGRARARWAPGRACAASPRP